MKTRVLIIVLLLIGVGVWGVTTNSVSQQDNKKKGLAEISPVSEFSTSKPVLKPSIEAKGSNLKQGSIQIHDQFFDISGGVIDDKGNPVPNVSLLLNVETQEGIKTDAKGGYRFQIAAAKVAESDIKIRFIKHGYVLQSKKILDAKNDERSSYRINVVLDRISGYAVSGYVLDDIDQQGVAGIRLSLYSKEQQRATRIVASDDRGYFSIPYVPPANDYVVRVVNTASYVVEPYHLPTNVTVSDAPINLTLLATRVDADVDTLNLNVRDSYSLPLETLKASISQAEKTIATAITDANGSASFVDVPKGKLTFEIDSLGMRVTGLERNLHDNVTIIADVGYSDLVINVLDERGLPVVCQQASLFYSYAQEGYTVRSTTPLAYDENKVIRYSGLGDGRRKLLLSGCHQHQGASVELELSSVTEIEVRLVPRGS